MTGVESHVMRMAWAITLTKVGGLAHDRVQISILPAALEKAGQVMSRSRGVSGGNYRSASYSDVLRLVVTYGSYSVDRAILKYGRVKTQVRLAATLIPCLPLCFLPRQRYSLDRLPCSVRKLLRKSQKRLLRIKVHSY